MSNTIKQLLSDLHEFERIIGCPFKNKGNLICALTHSSFANENKQLGLQSNERLEFLGDAVLNVIISERIFLNYGNLSEGEMTKARAAIVCESSLVKCANQVNISKYLLLGKGEELTGGRTRPSILSDAFEALIGAIYIDSGFGKAREFVINTMKQITEDAVKGEERPDYKTQFQEIIQKKGNNKIKYELLAEKGPDHDKVFITQVKVNEEVLGKGKGKSKKEAEQNAAKDALKKIL